MEWLKSINDALDYLEEHLEEPFAVTKIAEIAASSPFHFQRMFYILTGSTLVEYLRKRRLTIAAQELAATKVKVLEIALKYGYDSPESFSKAFRKMHGVSPSAVRKPGSTLKAYPRISFYLSLKGDQEMDYKIIEQQAFQVIGKAKQISTRDGINFKQIPEFWQASCAEQICENLTPYNKTENLLGICLDHKMEEETFTYMIAVESECKSAPTEFITRTIPASTWAVFTSIGPMPSAIQKVFERIYQEWFPSTNYEHAGTAELEVYLPGNNSADDYRCEVWIPIKKIN